MVTADEAIEVLRYLELCIPLEEGIYQITALLNDEIPANAWAEDPKFDVYRGQRYECAESVDIISPSSFVILQSRCSSMTNLMWKDGIRLIKIVGSRLIQCLITMGVKKGHHCIDVVLRWASKDDCEAVAKEFLDELKSMIADVCDERSPGVILDWFYLDSSHLKQLNSDPAVYSSREVDQKVSGSSLDHKILSIRPEGDNDICIRDLVILSPEIEFPSGVRTFENSFSIILYLGSFPADDEPVSNALMKACASIDGSKWETLAIALDISLNDRKDIGEFTRENFSRMFKVLELWKKQSTSSTVGQLLCAFREFCDISRRAIKKKFNELSGQ